MTTRAAVPKEHLRIAMLACPYGDGPERIAPLGAMSVLSYAKATLGDRLDTMVFDFSSAAPNELSVLEPLLAWRPDVVGVPVYTNQVQIVDRWIAHVRQALPEAVLVAGGPHPTLTADSYLSRRSKLFDLLIRGDGETPMAELMRRLLAGKADIAVPGSLIVDASGALKRMPDAVPIPPDAMADPLGVPIQHCNEPLVFTDRKTGKHRKAIALVSSRSCPLQCSFCAIIAMPGKWRSVPTDNLIDWLKLAHAREPFEHIYFMDANFFVVPTRVREIAARFEQDLPGITWSASSTVGMLLKVAKDLPALKRSGLRMVEMGIEAGSQRQLRFLNKAATVTQNVDAVRALQQNRIDIGLDFIMFYPDQTMEDLRENLKFLRNADLTLQEDFGHFFNSLVLYPGTPIRDLYANRHKATFDPDSLPDITPLFVNKDVRAIYEMFSGDFRERYLPVVQRTLVRLRRAAIDLAKLAPVDAQRYRLQAIQVHHTPYKVLWELSNGAPRATLEESVPWLPKWVEYADSLVREIGAPQVHMAAGSAGLSSQVAELQTAS